MRVVRHWSRVYVDLDGREDRRGPAAAFGWSAESAEAARAHALERARRVAARLREGRPERRSWEYYGDPDRPPREPVVEVLGDEAAPDAVVTRNAYGAWVLNAARVVFVDIDEPPAPEVGFFARLLGGSAPAGPSIPDRVAAVAREQGLGLRLYRTKAGYRAVLTDRVATPDDPVVRGLFESLGADPQYVRMCEVQQCFRARLSPKPWRIGLMSPQTHYYPWDDDPLRQAAFDTWSERYRITSAAWSVCARVEPSGPAEVHPEVVAALALHDRWCLGGRPLA